MCRLICKDMPEMDRMICESYSGPGLPSWELISLNIIGRTNELVLYVIVIVLIVA